MLNVGSFDRKEEVGAGGVEVGYTEGRGEVIDALGITAIVRVGYCYLL